MPVQGRSISVATNQAWSAGHIRFGLLAGAGNAEAELGEVERLYPEHDLGSTTYEL
jgi:hypothetical protein